VLVLPDLVPVLPALVSPLVLLLLPGTDTATAAITDSQLLLPGTDNP
jgi:hypothetical protein